MEISLKLVFVLSSFFYACIYYMYFIVLYAYLHVSCSPNKYNQKSNQDCGIR